MLLFLALHLPKQVDGADIEEAGMADMEEVDGAVGDVNVDQPMV